MIDVIGETDQLAGHDENRGLDETNEGQTQGLARDDLAW